MRSGVAPMESETGETGEQGLKKVRDCRAAVHASSQLSCS